MTKETAQRIYDVLVREAGARATKRAFFALYFSGIDRGQEFRFMGSLGFGGKIHRNCGEVLVTCYREEETPERLATIARCHDEIRGVLETDE